MKFVSFFSLLIFSAFLLLPTKDSIKCPENQIVIITIDNGDINFSCKLKD